MLRKHRSQGRLDMVQFWKDVATKAPHHSKASWMKYWRRHKHEFNRTDTDAPLPPAPEKKMRYSRQDDILLAKYFFERPTGTSDSIFQAFGRKVCILTCVFERRKLIVTTCSIHIIHGRVGKNIIEYIKPRLITLSLCYNEEKALMVKCSVHLDPFYLCYPDFSDMCSN